MKQKIKQFFSSLLNKKALLILVFVFSGTFFFPRPVSATAQWILDIALYIPTRLVLLLFWLVAKLVLLITLLAQVLFKWVIGPNFIQFAYTKPGPSAPDNPIIQIGLEITQGFTNMVLVLALVCIALATILRLKEYEAKKLLPIFIAIALLVNFSPVISGLIVDASNIAMNYFLTKIITADFVGGLNNRTNEILADKKWTGLAVADALNPIFEITVMMVFLWVLTFVLLLFALLFTLRHLIIWFLVILSPLAFACYILPATRKYWTLWWNQFIQWSIIGVTCGFFLFLGGTLLQLTESIVKASPATTGEITPIFTNALVYSVPLVFLAVGLVFGLQTSAMGANTIISLGRKMETMGRRAAKYIPAKAWENIRPAVADKLRLKEAAGAVTRTWEKIPVAKWFMPQRVRQYSQYRPAVDESQKQLSYLSSKDLGRMLWTGVFKGVQKTAALKELASRGDAQDLFEEGKKRFGIKTKGPEGDMELLRKPKSQKTLGRMTEMALFSGYHNYILRRDPRLGAAAAHAGLPGYLYPEEVETRKQKRDFLKSIEKLPKEEREKKWKELEEKGMEKASSEMRAKHLPDVEREVAENKVVVEKWMERGREMLEPAGRTLKRGVATIQKTMNEIFSEYVDEVLQKELPGLAQDIKQKAENVEELAKAVKAGETEKIPELGQAREELKAMSAAQNIKQKAETVEELAKAVKAGETEKIPELGKAREELKAMSANVWDIQFRNWYRKKHSGKEGIFKYVGTQRATEEGWEKGEYLLSGDRYPEKAKTAAGAVGVERTEPPGAYGVSGRPTGAPPGSYGVSGPPPTEAEGAD